MLVLISISICFLFLFLPWYPSSMEGEREGDNNPIDSPEENSTVFADV